LTSEQKMVRLMARDFAKRELEPYACERDKNEIFPAEVIRKMGELGLMGMMVPPEYGGSGAGAVSYSLATPGDRLCLRFHSRHHVRRKPVH